MTSGAEPVLPTAVVFDSNVLIPLSIPASASTYLFLRLQAAGIEVVVSPQILAEVRDKMLNKRSLRKWHGLTDADVNRFVDHLSVLCAEVPGLRNAHGSVPADPDDETIIAAALETKAEYIVSEDRHLLDLVAYQEIRIVSRQQLEAELDRLDVPPLTD